METKEFEGVEFNSEGLYWSKRKNCWYCGSNRGNGYMQVGLNGKRFNIHRIIAKLFIPNDNPNFTVVNHKNRDRSDNRVENLEWTNPRINQHNRSDQSWLGVGIYETPSGKFLVKIYINGKQEYFGYYHETVADAKFVRNAVYIKHGISIPD